MTYKPHTHCHTIREWALGKPVQYLSKRRGYWVCTTTIGLDSLVHKSSSTTVFTQSTITQRCTTRISLINNGNCTRVSRKLL